MTNSWFPTTAEEIHPDWLTQVLRERDVLQTGSVTHVQAQPIEKGNAGSLARLTISYSKEGAQGPHSLIAKCASKFEKTKTNLISLGLYEREVRFYRELADTIPVRTPQCYFSGLNESDGEFLLLLEDLGSLREGAPWDESVSEDTNSAINRLALLHSSMWDDPALGNISWLPKYDDGVQAMEVEERYKQNWIRNQESPILRLSKEATTFGRRLVDNVAKIKEYLARPPVTLVHADFKVGNLLFGEPGDNEAVVVLDWQLCRIGKGSYDITYLTSGIPLEPRIEAISLYHRTLTECGVSNYPWEQCLLDCQWAALDLFIFYVNVSMTIDLTSERGQKTLNEIFPYNIEMAMQLGAEPLSLMGS